MVVNASVKDSLQKDHMLFSGLKLSHLTLLAVSGRVKSRICPGRLESWASPWFSCLNTVCTCTSPILACQIIGPNSAFSNADTSLLPEELLFYPRQYKNGRRFLGMERRVPLGAGKRAGDLCSLRQAGMQETLWVAVTFPSPTLSELKCESRGGGQYCSLLCV